MPGDGGSEFPAAGQFRDKLVFSDLLQVVADRRVDDDAVIEQVGKEVLLLCSQFTVPEHFIINNKSNR